MKLKKIDLVCDNDVKSFSWLVLEESKDIKDEMLNLNNNTIPNNLLEKYNRLNKTKRLIKEYKPMINNYKDYVSR